ncbi:MAG: hypothetical protein ABIJ96_12720 [Elusimicrobiota bacterium]
MRIAAGVFTALVIGRNMGAWLYAARALDARSVGMILFHAVLPVASLICAATVLWGAGRRLLRLFGLEMNESVEQITSFSLGLGLTGTALLLLGLAGGLNIWGILCLTAAAAGYALPELCRTFDMDIPAPPKLNWWRGVLLGLMGYALWHAAVAALAPPAGWDVTAYHLALPKLYLRAGAVREIPWLLHSHWPHLMELLYTFALAVGMDQAAALLHAAVCAALVLAVAAAARTEFDSATAWFAAALIACQLVLLRIAPMAHSDGAYALFAFLSSWTVWRWTRERTRALLVLGGLLGGFSAAAKLLGVYPTLINAAWIAVHVRKERQGGRAAPLIYLACVLAVMAPWLLKTWIGAGNPLWPFFSEMLGGRFGAEAIEAAYLSSNYWTWPPDSVQILRYGPQFLLVPAALLAAAASLRGHALPPFVRFLLIQALMFVPLVFRHNEGWRFFLPFYPALAVTAGWAAARLIKGRAAVCAGAALALAFGLLPVLTATQNNELFAVLGLRSQVQPGRDPRELYLERRLDHYSFYLEVNKLLPPRAKVLLFREIRGYYLDLDYMWGDPLNQGQIAYADLDGPDQLYARLRELGVTHILVNKGLAMYAPRDGYYDPKTVLMMERTLSRFSRRMLARQPLELYRLDL